MESDSDSDLPTPVPDEFTCGCCYDLLLGPVTLTCGHTFCQPCLVKWVTTSKKFECLTCRQPFHGTPLANIALGAALERLYEAQLRLRRANMSSEQLNSYGDNYAPAMEAATEGSRRGARSTHDVRVAFILGLFAGVAGMIALWLVIYVGSGLFAWAGSGWGGGYLSAKPPGRWSSHEVAFWLGDLGEWAKEYGSSAEQNGIDGRLLLSLTNTTIEAALFSGTSTPPDVAVLHAASILVAIDSLRAAGTKPPSDLWELKAVRQLDVIFYMFSLHHAPRLTLAYMYTFDYEATFAPLFRSAGFFGGRKVIHEDEEGDLADEAMKIPGQACFVSDTDDSECDILTASPIIEDEYNIPWYDRTTDPLTWFEYIVFWTISIISPYVQLGRLAWAWCGVNTWPCLCALFILLVVQGRELDTWRRNVSAGTCFGGIISWASVSSSILLLYLFITLFYAVTPSFLWDILFYLELYLSPWFHTADAVKAVWVAWYGRREQPEGEATPNVGETIPDTAHERFTDEPVD